jgi:hypothetical protein
VGWVLEDTFLNDYFVSGNGPSLQVAQVEESKYGYKISIGIVHWERQKYKREDILRNIPL